MRYRRNSNGLDDICRRKTSYPYNPALVSTEKAQETAIKIPWRGSYTRYILSSGEECIEEIYKKMSEEGELADYYKRCAREYAKEERAIRNRIAGCNLLYRPFLLLYFAKRLSELEGSIKGADYWCSWFDTHDYGEMVLRLRQATRAAHGLRRT